MFDLRISEVESGEQERQVVSLLRDYFLWLRRRYVAEMAILDAHYDSAEREAELADLRGHYATPGGAIFIAHVDGVAAGCVMFRPAAPGVCEMRRLFVRPAFHGMGIARALVCKLAQMAVARGYRSIRLETGPRQFEAQSLYRDIGFKRVSPYYEVTGWFADNMLFMQADAHEIACERTATRRLDRLARAA